MADTTLTDRHTQPGATPRQINDWVTKHSPFHQLLGMTVERVDTQQAVCGLQLREDFYHGGGVLHGGVSYALADSAVGMLIINRIGVHRQTFTIEGKLNYLASLPKGTAGLLTATATLVSMGRTIAVADTDVHAPDGRLLCHGMFTYAIIAADT